jgi:hypothetical protein
MKKIKRCDAAETSGEDPVDCSLPAGHDGAHRSAEWSRYDAKGQKMKRGKQWLVWTGRTIGESEF